jgi:hypothetical protein
MASAKLCSLSITERIYDDDYLLKNCWSLYPRKRQTLHDICEVGGTPDVCREFDLRFA